MFQPSRCTVSSIRAKRLLNTVCQFLTGEIADPGIIDSEPRWDKIIVTLNGVSAQDKNTIGSADILSKNSWGEIYFHTLDLTHIENNIFKCYEIATKIWGY